MTMATAEIKKAAEVAFSEHGIEDWDVVPRDYGNVYMLFGTLYGGPTAPAHMVVRELLRSELDKDPGLIAATVADMATSLRSQIGDPHHVPREAD